VINHLHVLGKFVVKVKGYKGPVIEDGSKSRNLFSASLINQEGVLDKIPKESYDQLSPEHKALVDWFNEQLEKGYQHALSDPIFASSLSKSSPPTKIQNLRADLVSGVQLLRLLEVSIFLLPCHPLRLDPFIIIEG